MSKVIITSGQGVLGMTACRETGRGGQDNMLRSTLDQKEIWRPRRDSNTRPPVSTHFDFRRRLSAFVVWTIPSPWTGANPGI